MKSFIIIFTVVLTSRGQYIDEDLETPDDGKIWMDMSKVTGNNTCFISINKTSCQYFRHYLDIYNPNFVKLQLRFRYVHGRYSNTSWIEDGSNRPYLLEPSTSFTEQAIRPYEWVWTYYSTESFFPYLKWPTDFAIVSFNLLAAKTLKIPSFVAVEIHNLSCYITIGQENTTEALSYAFRDLTRDFLIGPNNDHQFDYSYWCYLSVVPGMKDTVSYKLAIHIGYTSDFVQYNCCRTTLPPSGNKTLLIGCKGKEVHEMWQSTILPYVLGVIATAFFPLGIFKLGVMFRNTTMRKSRFNASIMEEEEWDVCSEVFDKWIFLNDNAPISFSNLVINLCGLGSKYPVSMSRLWRLAMLLCGPIVLYYQLYVYSRYQYDTVLELIDHDIPIGYLSMLGGFEKSRQNFMPNFGGPFCLLIIVGIGDKYLELLSDVVDISSQLENGLYSNQVIDKVLIIDDSIPSDINKIQIRDCFIQLTSIQQKSVHDARREPRKPKIIIKNNSSGIPRDLFKVVVDKHHPVYMQVTHALLKIGIILALIIITIGIVYQNPTNSGATVSEMMHVIFIMAIGALPRVIEIVIDGINHRVQKEIHLRELKCTINQYWCSQYNKVNDF
ncbi:hypothetical protein ACF0H5_008937 [Mactra antiquata]